VFLALIVIPHTPLSPLLRLSSNAVTLVTPVSVQAAWLCAPGLVLMAIAAFAANRLS